ncbi:MAG: transporter permease [Rubritepida sp.]|nr:transporter permease [Rubritepida sp.]
MSRPALLPLGLGLLLALLASGGAASLLWPEARVMDTPRLLSLAGSHARLAVIGAGIGIVLGVALGLLVTRSLGAPWRRPVDSLAAAAQAVPPMVAVALALPGFGFGAAPTVIALVLYGLMPVLRGTIGAVEAVPRAALDAALAIGLTPAQILRQVEWPLVWPLLLPALRSAVTLAMATAAVGALAGAATLGTPIVIGLQMQNEAMLFQGAAATAALAFLADGAMLLAAGFQSRGALPDRR